MQLCCRCACVAGDSLSRVVSLSLCACRRWGKQEIKIEAYFGRKVAVDASMSIYQFLIAMQRPDGTNMLTNDAGEVTSHLNGLMMRTTKMMECGIKPVYVFDGKPPKLKSGELALRSMRRAQAEKELAQAKVRRYRPNSTLCRNS